MLKIKSLHCFFLLGCTFFVGCSQNDLVEPVNSDVSKSDKLEQVSTETIPSVYDPNTKSFKVNNFYDYEFIHVQDVKDLPNPTTFDPSARQNHVSPGGAIDDTREIILGSGGGYEQYAKAPSGYVVTGVGAEISSSSNNYVSILLEYRYLYSDGSFGPRYRVWSGSTLEPWQLEAWYAVPNNAVVWGIGFRGSHDVKNMSIYYRYLNSATMRLSGGYTKANSGLEANGQNQILFLPQENGLDQDRAVVLGLALTSTSAGTTRMLIDAGILE